MWRAKPDIVQGVEPFAVSQLPYQFVIFLYAVIRQVPLIGGVHISRPLAEKYGRLPALLLKYLLQPYLRYTRFFFYMNEGGRRNLREMGVPERKMVRHMYGTWGVDLNEFATNRDGREPEWQGPTLLFVGRIDAEKGIFDLLEAFELVQREVPIVRLVMIGDGPQRAEVERVIHDCYSPDQVSCLGTVKNRDLPPYFRAATIFVSPSVTTRKWEEYVGMTNIQAMASGVPVVSTRSGAIPEYVPNGVAGILVPERNPVALAEAILTLLTDDALRQRIGEAGRAHAVARYDAGANVRHAEEIILDRCLNQ
ncbi:MAG: glycosyltransferase family 4 protein [Chloroflexota bacterium]|nr:glycosyltransferase family 4 protein [Chloroflexota bacterium]